MKVTIISSNVRSSMWVILYIYLQVPMEFWPPNCGHWPRLLQPPYRSLRSPSREPPAPDWSTRDRVVGCCCRQTRTAVGVEARCQHCSCWRCCCLPPAGAGRAGCRYPRWTRLATEGNAVRSADNGLNMFTYMSVEFYPGQQKTSPIRHEMSF